MNRLSDQERAGLEEVFLSISTPKRSLFKENLSLYQTNVQYYLKQRIRSIKASIHPIFHLKITPKTTSTHKNT